MLRTLSSINMYRSFSCLLCFLFIALHGFAQKKKKDEDNTKDDYVSGENTLVYNDHVYKKNIATVQLHRTDLEWSSPVISLNSNIKLQLSFDDLDADAKTYGYTFIHCDADWQPSNMLAQEYMSGFFDEQISDRKYSMNTLQPYTHYTLQFPTENVQITKSGNYIIEVFTDYDHENFVLSKRFMVVDEKVDLDVQVKPSSNVEERNYKQEVDFVLHANNYRITNPYEDLKVVLMQNDRWDNALTGIKPVFVKDKELDYDLGDGNQFYGGSEFRKVDIKSLRYHTERIAAIHIDSASQRYYVDLLTDENRSAKRYTNDIDINGRYKIYIQESKLNNETEADYIFVHFSLKADSPDKEGMFYLFGEFTDWQYKPEFRMKYNADEHIYECTAYIKQGYYNYEYVYLKDGSSVASEIPAEGTHWETENDYLVLIYNREMGTTWDQLIAVRHKNSVRNN